MSPITANLIELKTFLHTNIKTAPDAPLTKKHDEKKAKNEWSKVTLFTTKVSYTVTHTCTQSHRMHKKTRSSKIAPKYQHGNDLSSGQLMK